MTILIEPPTRTKCACGTPLPDEYGATDVCTWCQALAQRDGRTPEWEPVEKPYRVRGVR